MVLQNWSRKRIQDNKQGTNTLRNRANQTFIRTQRTKQLDSRKATHICQIRANSHDIF